MTNAADLPERSIVATANVAFIKRGNDGPLGGRYPWTGTGDEERVHTNHAITDLIQSGQARVLRVGDGT